MEEVMESGMEEVMEWCGIVLRIVCGIVLRIVCGIVLWIVCGIVLSFVCGIVLSFVCGIVCSNLVMSNELVFVSVFHHPSWCTQVIYFAIQEYAYLDSVGWTSWPIDPKVICSSIHNIKQHQYHTVTLKCNLPKWNLVISSVEIQSIY